MKKIIVAISLAGLLALPASAQWKMALEPNHSTVDFAVPIAGGMTRVTGKFKKFEIEVVYDEKDVSKSSVVATIAVSSVDTGIEDRDRDLQGKKFFDGANHPEITFRSTGIRPEGEGFVAAGELSIRGVTKPIELPFSFTRIEHNEEGRPRLGIAATITLNRQDWGVGSDWVHSAIPNFIGDEVTVSIFLWTRLGQPLEGPANR